MGITAFTMARPFFFLLPSTGFKHSNLSELRQHLIVSIVFIFVLFSVLVPEMGARVSPTLNNCG